MVADYVGLKQANCKNCYRCIRNCPVQAISYANNQARILDEDCVVCGRCFVACPQNAKEIRNDAPRAKALIASGRPVCAGIAPSFAADVLSPARKTPRKSATTRRAPKRS